MARVFIGIPTLNRPHYVRETIQSVLGQTFTDYTVVVSDNVSAPEVRESVARYVEGLNDDRFRFEQQPSNCGEYGQGRYFFSQVRDEDYFVILHDDDVLKPNYLERAVRQLDQTPQHAFFVANPYAMNADGKFSADKTRWFMSYYGRDGQNQGQIDVLHKLLKCGFSPISGTCFRAEALRKSGFVDADCTGNFPFEMNIFLRLGECGASAWFCTEELLGFRFHSESLLSYLHLMENMQVVQTMTRLLERRNFTGENEHRRRVLLGRMYRAASLIKLRRGDTAGARSDALTAVLWNARSPKNVLTAPAVWIAPPLLRRALPKLPELRSAPKYEPPVNTASAAASFEHQPVAVGI